MLKTARVRSEKHRRWIASLPCCVSGLEGQTQAAHIRTGCGAGLGLKSGDDWCVPLSWYQHNRQHSTSEALFWGRALEAAKQLAQDLYKVTGNDESGRKLVREFRQQYFGWT